MTTANCVRGSGFGVRGTCPQPPTPHPELAHLRGAGGFTFVELLIVGLIVVLVVNGMAWALASSGQNIWRWTDAEMTSLAAAQRALDRLSDDLRRATRGETDTTKQMTCEANQITFYPAAGGSAVTYSLDNGSLVRTQDAAAKPMAGQIVAFTPSCQANGLVRLQLTAQTAVGSTAASVTQTFSSQVRVPSP